MSRIAKKPIVLPANVELSISAGKAIVKGPKGTLEREIPSLVTVAVNGKEVQVAPAAGKEEGNVFSGTYVSHLKNMIKGVSETYTKKLIIEGIGYKADIKGTDITFSLGYSHQITLKIPPTLKVTSDKGVVTVTGSNKEEVGQFAANIRALKKPEPYKGKGIHYEDEVVRRKQGKKTA